jgi:hypothetical protein
VTAGLVAAAALHPAWVAPAAAAPGADVRVEEETVSLAGGEQRGFWVKCPSGTRVTGGGVGTFGSVKSQILVSGPLDSTGTTLDTGDGDVARFWYAAVYNGGSVARNYRVFALCSATSDATVEATTVNVPVERFGGSGVATCPSGRRVVGGGLGTTHAAIDVPRSVGSTWQMQHSGPLDETGTTAGTTNGDIARSWYASWRQQAGGPARVYKVFALCSSTSDATIAAASMSVPSNGTRGAAATCPTGRRISGGGIGTPATPVNDYVRLSGPLGLSGSTADTLDGDRAIYWYADAYNSSGATREYKVLALCVANP